MDTTYNFYDLRPAIQYVAEETGSILVKRFFIVIISSVIDNFGKHGQVPKRPFLVERE
jgi:hypothetical protein